MASSSKSNTEEKKKNAISHGLNDGVKKSMHRLAFQKCNDSAITFTILTNNNNKQVPTPANLPKHCNVTLF